MGRRGNWELFLEVIGFGLGADCSADVVAHMQELSEDMGTNETAGAGDEDERLFRGHEGRSEGKVGCRESGAAAAIFRRRCRDADPHRCCCLPTFPEDTDSMTLLALELGSLHPEIPIPIIKQTLKHIESRLYIVIFFTQDLVSELDTPAKRAGQFKQLQDLVSGLYVCTAAETELPCSVVFADWCGYSLQEETWEYNILFIPECMPPPRLSEDLVLTVVMPEMVTRLPKSSFSVRTVAYLSTPKEIQTEVSEPSQGKDHPVVAGSFPFPLWRMVLWIQWEEPSIIFMPVIKFCFA
jgi:hypothetical protein